jgi:lipopolysaccharide heptosyltransferase II
MAAMRMRIVCFHLNQVGDLVFSLPALKCIRESFPDAHVTSVVRPGAVEVLEATSLADDVLSRNSCPHLNKYRLARQLSRGNYDLAVVFSQSAECAILSYLTRAPKRIGFVNTSLGRLLTKHMEFHHPPSTENNLRLVQAAGCEIVKRDYAGLLTPSQAQIDRADKILAANSVASTDRIVTLAPGTSGRRSVKEWTDDGFAAVGRYLIDCGFKPVVLGTQLATRVVEENEGILDLSGRTSLGDAVAILARSAALVAVDSGILHLGAAVGTRVVGLYGPSNPEITGPRGEGHVVLRSGIECSPCIRTECDRGRECMLRIEPEAVISALDGVLKCEALAP